MFWIVNLLLTGFQKFCVNIIKCGPIPRHVAFIMDGNRRYAAKAKVQKAEGHIKGSDKLFETLKWCLELGIKEATVYAFSIENFKRSKEEVEALMKVAAEKLQIILDKKEKIISEGVCIRTIGNLSLLSEELRKLIAQAMLMTKDNDKLYLNIAFAYTSRDEITNAAKIVIEGVEKGSITVDDIDEDLISNCLYTNNSPDPDLIIRTSGEVRFSDFLLWQISDSQICFTKVLWPEFCIWHLLACVFKYQRSYKDLKKFQSVKQGPHRSENVQKFLNKLHQKKLAHLQSFII